MLDFIRVFLHENDNVRVTLLLFDANGSAESRHHRSLPVAVATVTHTHTVHLMSRSSSQCNTVSISLTYGFTLPLNRYRHRSTNHQWCPTVRNTFTIFGAHFIFHSKIWILFLYLEINNYDILLSISNDRRFHFHFVTAFY